MDTIISTATTSFNSTVGFSLDSVLDFVIVQIKLVIGTGLGVLQTIIPLLLAVVAIGAIIGLIWMGYRFFRH